jgi:hypothetical protein
MSDTIDLEAVKARLAVITGGGPWEWHDVARGIPYEGGTTYLGDSKRPLRPGNDGSLGLMQLYCVRQVNEDEWHLEPILYIDEEIPETIRGTNYRQWRGFLKAPNLVDLEFIVRAPEDVAALIAEVERLRALLGI